MHSWGLIASSHLYAEIEVALVRLQTFEAQIARRVPPKRGMLARRVPTPRWSGRYLPSVSEHSSATMARETRRNTRRPRRRALGQHAMPNLSQDARSVGSMHSARSGLTCMDRRCIAVSLLHARSSGCRSAGMSLGRRGVLAALFARIYDGGSACPAKTATTP